MANARDFILYFGIIASIIGAAIAYGSNVQEITETKTDVKEIKVELKEKRKVDLEQTILLKETVIQIKHLAEAVGELKK